MGVYLLLAKRAGRSRRSKGGTVESRTARGMIRAGSVFTLVFLYVPLVVVIVYAFNPDRPEVAAAPVTAKYSAQAWHNPDVHSALHTPS